MSDQSPELWKVCYTESITLKQKDLLKILVTRLQWIKFGMFEGEGWGMETDNNGIIRDEEQTWESALCQSAWRMSRKGMWVGDSENEEENNEEENGEETRQWEGGVLSNRTTARAPAWGREHIIGMVPKYFIISDVIGILYKI